MPLGLALMVFGLVVLLVASIVWALSPTATPERIQVALVALPPTATAGPPPTPASLATAVVEQQGLTGLLPETPLPGSGLPSFAAPDQAPRELERPAVAGQPTRLVIPALGVDAPVSEVRLEAVEKDGAPFFQWQVLAGYAAGWHAGSAPLGRPGNTVLNGHHNVYGEVFRYLVNLEVGDEIILYDLEQSYSYQVSQQLLLPEESESVAVRQSNASWIGPTADERITLVTCWPYTGNSHRLIVVARPASASGS